MRSEAENENSTIWAYDYVNVFILNALNSLIESWTNQLVIGTATELGLSAWEEFLKIADGSTKTISTRRAIIRAKLGAKFTTIENMKKVIEAFLPANTVYQVIELRKDPDASSSNVFDYAVEVPEGVISDTLYNEMLDILREIQPAHCNLILNEITALVDSIWVSDDISTTYNHEELIRADEDTPSVNDQVRPVGSWPLEWWYWSDIYTP